MKKFHVFHIPEGQKVTEKQLILALVVTCCSILVCLACMVGSAWAWYSVQVESTGNQIAVGTFPTEATETTGATESTEAAETEPQETEPQETEPQETEPQETEPQETEPAETEPAETEPAETEPTEG